MEGKDGRTERATPRRRSRARREGNLPVSQDVVAVADLFLGVVALTWGVPYAAHLLKQFNIQLSHFTTRQNWSIPMVQDGFVSMCFFMGAVALPIILPIMLGGVLGTMIQTKPYFSTQPLRWKFDGLNPISGLRRLFSVNSLFQLGTSLLKCALVVLVLYVVLRKNWLGIMSLHRLEVADAAMWIFELSLKMIWAVVALAISVAVIDWIYQHRKHEKSLMMTKEEVKEERKTMEPNPMIKRVQFKKMRELTFLRMMAEVPNATVVITNPTHVAVALKYEPETMNAPVVVAKGLRLVALRIRSIAEEHGIPVIERPPLARSLYKHGHIGREIPPTFFGAVAELLAYLFRIGNAHVREKLMPRMTLKQG